MYLEWVGGGRAVLIPKLQKKNTSGSELGWVIGLQIAYLLRLMATF